MPKYEHLLWIDLETTGTDEQRDGICEAAAILTTPDLTRISTMQAVLDPGHIAWQRLHGDDDFVLKMHQASGLYQQLEASRAALEYSFQFGEQLVQSIQEKGARAHQVMIAGSGVAHFDRRFIHHHMPNLDRFLAYPALDVGVLRRAAEMWGMDMHDYPEDVKTHRALDDIEHHLNEGRWFQARFGEPNT